MGRYGAEINLPTLYKVFYRLSSVEFIMSRAAGLWNVHSDSGRLAVERDGKGAILLRIEDFETPHPAHCLSPLGWASRSIEISGGKLTQAEERSCRARGDAMCERAFQWR